MTKKTVLLVEDNPDHEELVLLAFQQTGILNEVVVVRDGVEALDYLFGKGVFTNRDINAMPAVVLLDLSLPRISGLEVLQKLRDAERTRVLPVVVFTTSNQQQDLINSYKFGCNSYIRKPVDFTQFHDALHQLGLYWLILNELPPMLSVR